MNGSLDAGHLLIRQPIFTASKTSPEIGSKEKWHEPIVLSTFYSLNNTSCNLPHCH